MTVGSEIKHSVVSQKREHLVAGSVDSLTEVEGVLERLCGVVAHGHPNVVATEAAFALSGEIHNEFVT